MTKRAAQGELSVQNNFDAAAGLKEYSRKSYHPSNPFKALNLTVRIGRCKWLIRRSVELEWKKYTSF